VSAVATAAGLVSFPVGTGAAGAALAAWRKPGPRLTSAVQHFAAGVVLAAVARSVGWEPKYASRSFRIAYGMSPTEFRRQRPPPLRDD